MTKPAKSAKKAQGEELALRNFTAEQSEAYDLAIAHLSQNVSRTVITLATDHETIAVARAITQWFTSNFGSRVCFLTHKMHELRQAHAFFKSAFRGHPKAAVIESLEQDNGSAQVLFSTFKTMSRIKDHYGPESFGLIIAHMAEKERKLPHRGDVDYLRPKHKIRMTALVANKSPLKPRTPPNTESSDDKPVQLEIPRPSATQTAATTEAPTIGQCLLGLSFAPPKAKPVAPAEEPVVVEEPVVPAPEPPVVEPAPEPLSALDDAELDEKGEFVHYEDASARAQELGIDSGTSYQLMQRYKEDSRLPRNPAKKYWRVWIDFNHYLGTTRHFEGKKRNGNT